MKVNVYDLLEIYEKEVSRNTKNKRKINNFERNKMENIYDIKNIIESGNYKVGKYNIFNIKEPKYRIVMSLTVKDKIINHYVARNILLKNLDKYLDIRNGATRKKMGLDYAIKLLIKYLEEERKKGKFYILKIDISKYDVIYLGYPIWWGNVPKIILSFIDNTNLDGKTVAPFCTSGSSGITQPAEQTTRSTIKNGAILLILFRILL